MELNQRGRERFIGWNGLWGQCRHGSPECRTPTSARRTEQMAPESKVAASPPRPRLSFWPISRIEVRDLREPPLVPVDDRILLNQQLSDLSLRQPLTGRRQRRPGQRHQQYRRQRLAHQPNFRRSLAARAGVQQRAPAQEQRR